MNHIKALIVDDSTIIRKILKGILNSDPDIEVVYCAVDALDAQAFIEKEKPDVITLDLEMPKMNGITFLKKLMSTNPIPTVMISSHTKGGQAITLEALEAGAVDFITKPTSTADQGFSELQQDIIRRVKIAAKSNIRANQTKAIVSSPPVFKPQPTPHHNNPVSSNHIPSSASTATNTHIKSGPQKIIGIGASTGGVEHLARIIQLFPANTPAIVIVQHMPAGFTASFAKRLNTLATLHVKEAEHNEPITPGTIYIAPGGEKHMSITQQGRHYHVNLFEGDKVSFNRPSVDVLFDSIAECAGSNSACALMTGMGQDGAEGLLNCKNAGGRTVIQNKESCVVYGMPGHAEKIGAANEIVALEKIPETLLKMIF